MLTDIWRIGLSVSLMWVVSVGATQSYPTASSQPKRLARPMLAIGPLLGWNTFLGATQRDESYDLAMDSSGNIYVVGLSYNTWGTPVQAHAGNGDGFLAKLNSQGALVWSTFLGGSGYDKAYSVEVAGDSVYVAGLSLEAWGTPIRPFSGGDADAFVARLSAVDGVRSWHTFLGGTDFDDTLGGLDVDAHGYVYVAGNSLVGWGAPVVTHTVGQSSDVFVARLAPTGVLSWHTFMGAAYQAADLGGDYGRDLVTDGSYVYVAGHSDFTWGAPLRPFGGGVRDAFLTRLTASTGALDWHTFLGGSDDDIGLEVTLSGEAVFVAGQSSATWGTPVRPYSPHGYDGFVVRVTPAGQLSWNTFLGRGVNEPPVTTSDPVPNANEAYFDVIRGLAAGPNGHLYAVGDSSHGWGSPMRPFSVGPDAFVAQVNETTGALGWLTFLGGSQEDMGHALAVTSTDPPTLYVAGSSFATWGAPLRPFSDTDPNYTDAYVARLSPGLNIYLPMTLKSPTSN